MKRLQRIRRVMAVAAAATCIGLAAAGTARAIDVRDWGRKFPTDQRFVVLSQFNGEAVLDKETQLVWERYSSNVNTYQIVASYRCTRARIGGRMGWRLPTIAELASLVDPATSADVKLPAGHPLRSADQTSLTAGTTWWSSTFDRTSVQTPSSLATYRYYALPLDDAEPIYHHGAMLLDSICVRGADTAAAY